MKKQRIYTSILLSGLLLSLGVPSALAANNETTTRGTVNFKQQSDDSEGEVTLPDTEEEIIIPETGGKTRGPLRLTHVPDFDFDSLEIASQTIFGNGVLEKYKEEGQNESKDISHFVQVEDVRGDSSGWKLTVSASKFMPSDPANQPLEKSHIILQEGKMFNTRMSDTELLTKVSGFVPGVPITNNNEAVNIFGTISGQHTDSSKTSLVFNDAYTKDTPSAGSIEKGTGATAKLTNPGVQLKAVGTDEKAKDETYVATLKWTIADAK